MGVLRSESMKHGTLVLPVDRARHFIDLIGYHTNIQFEDMNARGMHRPYKKYIQRIDEMERMLRFLLDELTRVSGKSLLTNNTDDFLKHADNYKLEEVEAHLKQIHDNFVQLKQNNVRLTGKRNAALEESYVLHHAKASMAQQQSTSSRQSARYVSGDDAFESSASQALLDDTEDGIGRRSETMFNTIAGVIPQEDQERFARTLFKATRGNTYTHFQQIGTKLLDPKTGRETCKSVFVVYFQDQCCRTPVSAMSNMVKKICNSYGVNLYTWPASYEAAEKARISLEAELEEQQRVIQQHEKLVFNEAALLLDPARPSADSLIEEWRLFCAKEKAIYATLNHFEGDTTLMANCWYPAGEEDQIRALLSLHSSDQKCHAGAMLVPDRTYPRRGPPTYIRKNELTSVFQGLVDTIGYPRYGEVNPGLFTIVTFPFLFGVMYGDVGHGLMLFLGGLYCVWNAENLKFSLNIMYSARYMLVMMGFFSMYAGFLYNDFFSIGFDFFGSRWTPNPVDHQTKLVTFEPAYDIRNEGGRGPYPFGIDPAWHGAQNELIFLNSLKMKVSVIIGVLHMLTGLTMRFLNALHQRNKTDFLCECVPMLIFMVCFFGFMDYMILYKWVTPMSNPPSIINSLIAMGMWQEDKNPMLGSMLPRVLMVLTLITVPWLLIPKPFVLLMSHQQRASPQRQAGDGFQTLNEQARLTDEEAGKHEMLDHDDEEEFDIGEIVIHQVIETIEYVLGTISHTASYLRLWALSLAHQQLSLVFFSMTLLGGMSKPFPFNVLYVYIMFAVWFAITVAVLCGMDILECFLHTLRLHWVEFQSKFYKGDGYDFDPYSHRTVLEPKQE